jgi:ATPase family associated with various cellular activities (AAA)
MGVGESGPFASLRAGKAAMPAAQRSAALRPAFERLDAILACALPQASERFGADAAADAFRGLYVSAGQAAASLAGPPGAPMLAGGGLADPGPPALPSWDQVAFADSGWRWLRDSCRLTDQELDVILIALAPDADLRYERLYGYLQDDVTRRRPTVNLTLDLVSTTPEQKLAARALFAVGAPLLGQRLVSLVPDPGSPLPPLLAYIVALDPQIADVLLGQDGLDRGLAPICRLTGPPPGGWPDVPLPDAERDLLLGAVRAAWDHHPLRLHFRGPQGCVPLAAAEALAGELRVPLLVLDLPRIPDEVDDVLFRAMREASLQGALLYLEGLDALAGNGPVRPILAGHLGRYPGVAILAGHQAWVPLAGPPLGVVEVSFAQPGFDVRRHAWAASLTAAGVTVRPGLAGTLAGRFRCGPGQIADAVATAVSSARTADTELTQADLFAAARGQTAHLLAALARKIEPVYAWDDLVLPADSAAQLRELCQRVTLREQVMHDWGLERKLSLGRGTIALFTGPPGTGKTMAAEVVARELGLDLFKIDLSSMISKYIGETEKNLERIFTAATDADAILMFDEADALFGKRSAVRDSHDRYANIEVSYLLQRMEQYDGIAILATNLREHLDDAFTRRLQFIIDFPFPNDAERRRIWANCLHGVPHESQIDVGQLGRDFRFSGANIKNAVLHAAFLAAAQDSRIGMHQVLQAVRSEHYKMGKVPPGVEDSAPPGAGTSAERAAG